MNIKNSKFCLLLLALVLLSGCQEAEGQAKIEKKGVPPTNPEVVRLFVVGDIIYHQPVYRNLPKNQDPSAFKSHYELLENHIQGADFALANFEGSVSPSGQIHSYPMFQVPHETVRALKSNGFDALSTANNHCLDGSVGGLKKLISLCEEAGMKQFGTFLSPDSKGLIVDLKGIKVGFLAYSQSFNGLEGAVREEPYLIRPLNLDQVKADIDLMRPQCDYLLVLPHWGTEYAEGPSEDIKKLGEEILNQGADGIIASHPHVVQGVMRRNDGKFVAYSLGNSLSNQNRVYQKTKRVEGGLGLELTLLKKDKTRLINLKEVPTLVVNRQGKKQVAACQDVMDGKIEGISSEDQRRSQELFDQVIKDTTSY